MQAIDISKLISDLSVKRPIFHSEADFQHALAWQIHHAWPECSMRIEFKPPNCQSMYTDIWASAKETKSAIELKYKTRESHFKELEEEFHLLDHGAQILGRYDYLKDISRLEQVVANNRDVAAYAIFLTNDSAYWKPTLNRQIADAEFRIDENKKSIR